MKFVVDETNVVHLVYCASIFGYWTHYASLAKTPDEMIERLAQPDIRDGHEAPSPLVACDFCLLGMVES